MYKLSTKSVDNCGDNLKVNPKTPIDMHNSFKLVVFCTTAFILIYQLVTKYSSAWFPLVVKKTDSGTITIKLFPIAH